MTTSELFQMPDPDDYEATERHKHAVMNHLRSIFDSIDDALREALPKVSTLFKLWEGPTDLAVHAPNVRYLVKQYLASKATRAIEEDDVTFQMQRVSNCGLLVDARIGQIRILKATPAGVPKATSDARADFVEKNQQLTFRFGQKAAEPVVQSLGLFVIWRMDRDYKYVGMEIACPRLKRADGTVECYWIARFEKRKLSIAAKPKISLAQFEDLPITPKERKKSANEDEK